MTDTVSAPNKRGANGKFSIGDRDRAGRTMRQDKFAGLGLTFDDVLLLPAASSILPAEVDTTTRIAADISSALFLETRSR